jgi:hypothetical protein
MRHAAGTEKAGPGAVVRVLTDYHNPHIWQCCKLQRPKRCEWVDHSPTRHPVLQKLNQLLSLRPLPEFL